MKYSEEQIHRANSIDLADWLRSQGECLEKSGKEVRWKQHDSVTVDGPRWFQHSCSEGGYPIDFVTRFYGVGYREAVKMLIGEEPDESPSQAKVLAPTEVKPDNISTKSFQLPPRSDTDAVIRNYLVKERAIPDDLVSMLIYGNLIYEDAEHHNVVFVGYDDNGQERYAHCRSCTEKIRTDVAGSNKSYSFNINNKGCDTVYVFEAPIDLISAIAIDSSLLSKAALLSLGGTSGKALTQYLKDNPSVTKIALCLDSDQAGEEACKALSNKLPDHYTVLRIRPDEKDWNDVLKKANGSPVNFPAPEIIKIPESERPVDMLKFCDIQQTEVQWLWNPYLPKAKLAILQGNPGEGKTYLAMMIAAALSQGTALPNMEATRPCVVIYQTAEDGLSDTIKPRLIEAGANLERVMTINDIADPLTLTDTRIERAIRQNDAKLMIIDPVQAYIGANVDMNRANEVRPIFRGLSDVAQRTGCTILLIGHLNKTVGTQNAYRGLGSIDITASVRSVLFVSRDKDDPNIRMST